MSGPTRTQLSETLIKRLGWHEIDLVYVRRLIEQARDEDLNGLGLLEVPAITGDRSTESVAATPRESIAHLIAREDMVVCGLPLLAPILAAYGGGVAVQWHCKDGAAARVG